MVNRKCERKVSWPIWKYFCGRCLVVLWKVTKCRLRQFVFLSGRTRYCENKNPLYRVVLSCKHIKMPLPRPKVLFTTPRHQPAFPYCHYFLLIAKPLIPDRVLTDDRNFGKNTEICIYKLLNQLFALVFFFVLKSFTF